MITVEDEIAEARERVQASNEVRRETPVGSVKLRINGVVTGTVIGFKDEGQTPLVLYPGQPGNAAIGAASTVDLHGTHIGRQAALMFENGDPLRPVIMGLLRTPQAWPLPEQSGQVEVDADGERLVVTAKEQLVLRCGKASQPHIFATTAIKAVFASTSAIHAAQKLFAA